MTRERVRVEVGHKYGLVVLNYGTSEVAPHHIAWTPHEAREVARLLNEAADAAGGTASNPRPEGR